jgi:regulator of sirC expression with transglutaminase-like and TPR domain
MARAAAKRRQPAHHHDARRRHKDSGGQRFEDTLFFNRLRKNAKWMFVFLAVVFAGGFVVFGVGSSGLGLGDILNNSGGGGGGQPSIGKALKETQQDPRSAKAWRDLATAYDTKGELAGAISAWTTYTTLRPKDVAGFDALASDLQQQFANQTNDAAAAQADAQNAQRSSFGPPATSPLGRALGSIADPIEQAASTEATQRLNAALSARQETAQKLMETYQRIVALRKPPEPADSFLLAQAAENAGNAQVAIGAYKRFVQLAPDDPNAAYAKQQIKTLGAQSQG